MIATHTNQRSEVPRQAKATFDTRFKALYQPPATYRYQPLHDFWQVLVQHDSMSIRELHTHLTSAGWRRPQGGELTLNIARTDLVAMARKGFAE
jgi:hypothetical protein